MKAIKKLLQSLTYFDIGVILVLAILSIAFFSFFYRKAEYVNIRVKVTDKEVLYADPIFMFHSHFKGSIEFVIFNVINSILSWYWRKIYNFLPLSKKSKHGFDTLHSDIER